LNKLFLLHTFISCPRSNVKKQSANKWLRQQRCERKPDRIHLFNNALHQLHCHEKNHILIFGSERQQQNGAK